MVAKQKLEKQTAPAPLIVEEFTGGVELIERLAVEWRKLCAEGRCAQPFFQPEWIAAYLRAFAADNQLIVFTVRRQGKLRAVLPLIAETATLHGVPVRKLRSPSNVHSCRFDLVVGDEDEAETINALWQALHQRKNWDVIELLDVPEGGAGEELLRLATAEGHRGGQWGQPSGAYLVLPEAGNVEVMLQELTSSKLRKSLRYYRRNLEQQGALRFSRCVLEDQQLRERFYQLESAGWKGAEGTAIACAAQTLQFYDEVAGAAANLGYYTIYSLALNERIIAMQFGLTYGGRFHLLKPAYDESFSEFSPGQLLTYEVLSDLLARGRTEYDFMSPPSEWKSRWAKAVRPQSHLYIFRRGLMGHALYAWKFHVMWQARQIKQQFQTKPKV